MSDTNTPASGSSAGLTFAPPYDPSQELDPQTVQAVRENPDIRELRYFKEHAVYRTLCAECSEMIQEYHKKKKKLARMEGT